MKLTHESRCIAFRLGRQWATCLLLLCCASIAQGDGVSPEHAKFFENEVRPLLAQRCFECHGEDESEGDLRLDSLAAMLSGGQTGPAIVPGKPDESELIAAINYESLEMPPDEKLDDEEIAILTRWVSLGAPWPGANPNAPIRQKELFDEEDRQWWAIAPVVSPNVPSLPETHAQWARNEIDHFILDRIVSEGLAPAPEASKLAIVRRLYLDVTGLPPTPDQVDAFLNDQSPNAYETLVDQLLNSKGYGERAARAWLDLVRYADSDGYRADGHRPHAWRYRDYVIRSFNEDKPYDRFVQEQIAGDELFPEDLDAQIALGYLRHWVYEWNIRDARNQWKTILEDVTDTTADVFLGLGLQCAKCHNHKFDPLLQKDYFRLQAFLAPIMPIDKVVAEPAKIAEHDKKMADWEEKTASLRKQIGEIEQPFLDKFRNNAIDRFPDDLSEIARKKNEDRTPNETQLAYLVQRQVEDEYKLLDQTVSGETKEKLVALRRELKAFDELKPEPLPIAMLVSDVSSTATTTVMPKRTDEDILPGVPSILDPEPMLISPAQSGMTTGRRSALAKWVTDPRNPLSTRVIANRVWQSHFGRGLAENPSDFGRLGGPPSHPELLDWLTTRFIQDGWSLKSLHRLVLLSATYRQSTDHPQFDEFTQMDPANDLYWRRNTTRLSAEQIRDSLLTVTGTLKDYAGGKGVLPDSPYRTIYTQVNRNSPDQLLDSFDLPQFFSSNSTRNTTTTPVQSLMMINSDLMLGYARKLAAKVRSESKDPSQQIELAWKRVYGRQPTEVELSKSLAFIESQQADLEQANVAASNGLVETSKLPYRDGQGVKFDVKDASLRMSVPADATLNSDEFTVETFFQLRSIAQTGDVRTLMAKWDGSHQTPGWRFGVTGAGSRRKPQTLVLQMAGKKANGVVSEAAIFSDQHVEINTPYYASASFRLPRDGNPGTVTFYLKDLSNDDELLQTAKVEHDIVADIKNDLQLTIGGLSSNHNQSFDGLIDDVRLVGKALTVDEILFTVENQHPATIGYWQFETVPGVMRNSLGDRLHIQGQGKKVLSLSADEAALADFCHALLNSNEFLYQN
jgi:Protein of unknown function (DUF1553)/Protein of unknown function (DUF1549)/Planctomycete cytochrome C/Concanavalin A-like lectin/glucanases superfamily